MIAAPPGPPGPAPWEAARDRDPVVQRSRAVFALLDWAAVPGRDPRRPWPGRSPHPVAAYVKALLVKLCEGKPFVTDLRTFLVDHPLLVLEVGFRPVLDPAEPYGIRRGADRAGRALAAPSAAGPRSRCPRTAPGHHRGGAGGGHSGPGHDGGRRRQTPLRLGAREQPEGDDPPPLRPGPPTAGRSRLPPGGQAPHQPGWHHREGVPVGLRHRDRQRHRSDPRRCRAGRSDPAVQPPGRHLVPPRPRPGGRPSGPSPGQPRRRRRLRRLVRLPDLCRHRRLGRRPAQPPRPAPRTGCRRPSALRPGADDGGDHATSSTRMATGRRNTAAPCCARTPTGATCAHPRFATGRGCVKRINLEPGGRMRATLDRHSAAYRAVYRQRTSSERINSQAKALGIERPNVRSAAAVHRLNTLTYIIINVRALARVRARTAHAPPPITLC